MSVQPKSGGTGEFATSSASAAWRMPTAAPVICCTSGLLFSGMPSLSGKVLFDEQVAGAPPGSHFADQPETMNRCDTRLQDSDGSNMWSLRTKLFAYFQ